MLIETVIALGAGAASILVADEIEAANDQTWYVYDYVGNGGDEEEISPNDNESEA